MVPCVIDEVEAFMIHTLPTTIAAISAIIKGALPMNVSAKIFKGTSLST